MNYFDAPREIQKEFERWIASSDFTFDLMMQLNISDGKLKDESDKRNAAFLILLDTYFNRFCIRNLVTPDTHKDKK